MFQSSSQAFFFQRACVELLVDVAEELGFDEELTDDVEEADETERGAN